MPARKRRRFDRLLFERLQLNITDTSQAPRGIDLYYRCGHCDSFISSVPSQSTYCRCGRVSIDTDYNRLVIRDYSQFEVLRLLEDDASS